MVVAHYSPGHPDEVLAWVDPGKRLAPLGVQLVLRRLGSARHAAIKTIAFFMGAIIVLRMRVTRHYLALAL